MRSASPPPQPPPRRLEERTQAIGRELFAAARREHAHLSAMNRWTTQVLSWCLGEADVKSRVLQFIDALPSLRDPRDVVRHIRDYFPTTDLRLPPALRLGAALARPGPLTRTALSAVVHQLTEHVARQFIADVSAEGAARAIQALAERGAACSLDILGEQVLSEPEANAYAAQCSALLRETAGACARLASTPPSCCGPLPNVSIKPSALTPRFDPISPEDSVERAAARLLPLMQQAAGLKALITLDMEQYELRDLTLALARRVLQHSGGAAGARLGIVVQAYLRDAEASTDALLAWLASQDKALTVRLVKGAYWDAEVALAGQMHWTPPVFERKPQTDAAFERLTRRLLGAHPRVATAIASHNVRSIAQAMAAAELLGLTKDQLEFQLLYGMGDALHAAIRAQGYPVRIYTPIGQLIPGMAYLVRRILENTANESFLRQEFLQERSAEELLRPPEDAAPEPSAGVHVVNAGAPNWRHEPLTDFSRADGRDRMRAALEQARRGFGRAYPLYLGQGTMETNATAAVHNPARPKELLGSVAQADQAHVDRAVQEAAQAQPAWAAVPARERAACLRRAAGLMRRERDALAAWTVYEVGKTWREADVEIVEAIEYLEYYAWRMERISDGDGLESAPGERNLLRYSPRGVAAVIAPWNFPAAILTGMASAALVTGHAAIIKPAEQSPIIAAHIVRILREAGVPPSAVQLLPGVGEVVGAMLAHHPRVPLVLFTGSRAVGLSILRAAGNVPSGQRFIKHVVAEMGGKNAIIVDADADLDAAVGGILRSAFSYSGQKCSAASRVIAHTAVYERLMPRLIAATDRLVLGDPADPTTDLGPLIDVEARGRLVRARTRAEEAGRVAYAYPAIRTPKEGYFAGPVIATDVPSTNPLAREELFGPLLCVFRAPSFEAALALANDTDYALTGGVYSRAPSHIAQAVELFDVGNLYINRPITGAMVGRQPFGGHRLSGLGTKAGGPDYLRQLLLPKTVTTSTLRHGMPLE